MTVSFWCLFLIVAFNVHGSEAADKTMPPVIEKIVSSGLYNLKIRQFNVGFHKDLLIDEAVGPMELISQNILMMISRCGKIDFISFNSDELKVIKHQTLPRSSRVTYCKDEEKSALSGLLSGVRQLAFDSKYEFLYVLKTFSIMKRGSCDRQEKAVDMLQKVQCIGLSVDKFSLNIKFLNLKYVGKIYETTLRPKGMTSFTQLGGGMSVGDDSQVFFSVGDFGYLEKGFDIHSLNNSFGKIFRYDKASNTTKIFATGTRNSAGMFFNRANGQLLGVDHGPKGGDEINLIESGDFLGWPDSSYGVQYDADGYRDYPNAPTHFKGKKPLFAFMPDIGINSLSVVSNESNFIEWRGDILAVGLNSPELIRLRLDGNAVKYSERISTSASRMRFLKATRGGEILILSDDGRLTILDRAVATNLSGTK